jgi:hypothetical protein
VACRPISFFWTQWDGEHEGHCTNTQLIVYIDGGVSNPKVQPKIMSETLY